LQNISRTVPAQPVTPKEKRKKPKLPHLEDFLASRDYTGALTLLEFVRSTGKTVIEDTNQWVAYCAFHLGDYMKAKKEYEELTKQDGCHPDVWCNLAVCYFYLGMYRESQEAAMKGPKGRLQNRLLFHLAHKFGDESQVIHFHKSLQNIVEDQLSLAAMHYLRTHYQEAIDVYKRLLLDRRELLALNVYLAMCYHRLDYYDVSQEVLSSYVQMHPDSTVAINLKACNYYRLFNGKAAEVGTVHLWASK
jgi:intraflagellar transport protein 56